MYALLVLYITRVVHYLAGIREKVGMYAILVLYTRRVNHFSGRYKMNRTEEMYGIPVLYISIVIH